MPLGVVTVAVPVRDTVTVTGAGADVTVPRVMVAFTCCDWLFAVTPDVLSVRVRWGTVSPVPVVDVIDAVLELPDALAVTATVTADPDATPFVLAMRNGLSVLEAVKFAAFEEGTMINCNLCAHRAV